MAIDSVEPVVAGGRVAELGQMLAALSALLEPDPDSSESDAELIDQIALLERIKAAAAGAQAGEISEYVASIVCHETSHLDQATRRTVDGQLASRDLPGMSPKRATAVVRKLAYQADPAGAVNRARVEEKERRVSLRPAPDTMSLLSGYLPAAQGVATYAALCKAADSCTAAGDIRSRGQIMADTLVERVTGQATASDVNVEVNLLMPLDTLTDPDSSKPADVRGYGPIPAPLARALLQTTRGRVFLRRLFTSPAGQLVGVDSRRRRFDEGLATLIECRDQTCRDPYCDAPIRHLDHIHRHADGGASSLGNGRGECARGNYVKEMPGWHVQLINDGLGARPHEIRVTTPTGHTYTSQAPQPP